MFSLLSGEGDQCLDDGLKLPKNSRRVDLMNIYNFNVHYHFSAASKSGRANLKQSATREMTVTSKGPRQDLKMQGTCS